MINAKDSCIDNKDENYKMNSDLLMNYNNNNLSSGEKRIIKIKNNDYSISNSKLKKNITKRKIKSSLPMTNGSFSNILNGNEQSKKYFLESLEKETKDLDKNFNKQNYFKNEVPIYVNYSDYYYCPDSKKEQNLNIQIMKYLYENHLIENFSYNKNNKNNNKKKLLLIDINKNKKTNENNKENNK